MTGSQDQAVFGGGCFWCLEAVFVEVEGVTGVVSGYAGGHTADPDYRSVCGGNTGHAEVVRVAHDPTVVSFEDLLDVFFTIHDPTQLNRQGNDVGTQYRSVVFAQGDAQREATRRKIAQLEESGEFESAIVTEIADAAPFHPAEDYHQRYFENNAAQPYCQVVVAPKLATYRRRFGR